VTLPDPDVPPPPMPHVRRSSHAAIFAAVFGGGICLLAVIVGLVMLGVTDESDAQIAQTGLSSIGATLAGGFGGWIARGATTTRDDPRRKTDPQ
jgi:hypothetical protein